MNHEIDFSTDDIYIRECSSLFSVASLFPRDRGKTLHWMQVNSVLSSCLGKRPLQTSCQSEALTSSALIALTGSGRLFIAPFFTESSLWLIWGIAVRSIQPTVVKTDTKRNMRAVCVCVSYLLNKLLKWHKLTEVNYVFLNMVAICTLMNAAVQVN